MTSETAARLLHAIAGKYETRLLGVKQIGEREELQADIAMIAGILAELLDADQMSGA